MGKVITREWWNVQSAKLEFAFVSALRDNSSFGLNILGPLCLWQCLFLYLCETFDHLQMNMKFKDICYLLPMRMGILGPMGCGKSSFLVNFLRNIEKITNIKELEEKVLVDFFYNSPSSLKSANEAVEGKNCFAAINFFNGLPTIEEIENYSKANDKYRIVIFEDCIHAIRGQPINYIAALNTFVTNSRHFGVSIICILHELPFGGNSSRLSFEKSFLRNCTTMVLFDNLTSCQQIRLLMARIGVNYQDFEDVAKLVDKICQIDKENGVFSNPAIVLNMDNRQRFSDKLNRFAIDIFNRWILMKK